MANSYDYRVPPRDAREDAKLGWLREAVQEGNAFLQSQRAYYDFAKCYDIIAGTDEDRIPSYRSQVRSRRLKRQTREMVGTLSDLRPLWAYKTDNKQQDEQNNVLNKMLLGWWYNTYPDRGVRGAIQYAAVAGTGYLSPIWRNNYYTAGRGDIVLDSLGPHQVLPVQLPKDNDLQRAYSVTIVHEMPLALAQALHPEFADKIMADRDTPSLLRRGVEKMQKFLSPVLNAFGTSKKEAQQVLYPTVDVYHTYTMDMTVNETGAEIPMGEPGTSWQYTVPYIGQEIPTGVFNSGGQAIYRKATRKDCMLYPMRRLMVATKSLMISDDSSPWWHAGVPAIPVRTDDWPWEFLGYSVIRDGVDYDRSLTEHMRNVDDTAKLRLRPPLQYDTNAVSKSDMERFDTRKENARLGVNMQMGDAVKPILPYEHYDVPQFLFEHMQTLKDDMDYQLGMKDIVSLAKARAMPAGDIQQIEEFAGPVVKDISRGLERSMFEVGHMWKYLAFQFYNAPRRVQMLGENGLVEQDFDFAPGAMVPSHMPGEDVSAGPSKTNYFQRARAHADSFYFHIQRGSLHEITQMSQKLLYLQLSRNGFPLDPWTLAEVFDIPNFGSAPGGTTNVIERYRAWRRMLVEWSVEAQQLLQQAQAAGVLDQVLGGLPGQAEALAGQPQRQPGRPPTAQKPPHIVQKDGGTRSTIAES